jgi:hypothetical protein
VGGLKFSVRIEGALVDENPPILVCARCGDRIGVFEGLWVKLSDGTIRRSSILNLGKHVANEEARLWFWHAGCLAPDALPSAAEP